MRERVKEYAAWVVPWVKAHPQIVIPTVLAFFFGWFLTWLVMNRRIARMTHERYDLLANHKALEIAHSRLNREYMALVGGVNEALTRAREEAQASVPSQVARNQIAGARSRLREEPPSSEPRTWQERLHDDAFDHTEGREVAPHDENK